MMGEAENRSKRGGNMNPMLKAILRGLAFGSLLGAMFVAGFLFRGAVPSLAANNPYNLRPESMVGAQEYPLLAEAQSLLNEHYLKPLPPAKQLEYGAIRGMLATLNDRLTYFIDPPVAASESNVLAGKYGGIGVQVKRDEQGRFVLFPFRDGPAARAGVRDGDVLLKVNGSEVPLSTPQDAADQMLRGEVKDNNGVTIVVGRGKDLAEQKEFSIKFEVIEIPSVAWRILAEDANIGYIQLIRFTSRTPDELNEAFAELLGPNRDRIKALVLDVRNNPGGLLSESILVASQFLPKGTLILFERNRSGEKEFKVEQGAEIIDVPMVVLVNGGTASASELVAGALKDNKRATLIGQKTYGKGSVQLIFQLSDKSSIHITTAQFFPPSKTELDGVGIEPDVPMIPDQTGRDVELGEAIRFLQGKLAGK